MLILLTLVLVALIIGFLILDKISATLIIKSLKLETRKNRGQTINGYHTAFNILFVVMGTIVCMVISAFTDSVTAAVIVIIPLFYIGQLVQIFLEWKMLETDDYKVSLIQLSLLTVVLIIAYPFAAERLSVIGIL